MKKNQKIMTTLKKIAKQLLDEKKNLSKWTLTNPIFKICEPSDEIETEKNKNIKETLKDKSPVEVFETLFDDAIICEHFIQQSLLFATQNNRHSFFLTKNCLKNFIGFLLFTGYHALPQEQLNWSEDEDISIDCVRKCFPRNRYLEIKHNLHFNYNNEILNEGNLRKSYKIQPLFDKLNANYVKFGVFS